MEQGLPGDEPLTIYTFIAPHLWRILLSIGLLFLALIISG